MDGGKVATTDISHFKPEELSRDCFTLEEIGRGAFGCIYKAINKFDKTKKVYALKEINSAFAEKNQKVTSVMRERDILAALNGCR